MLDALGLDDFFLILGAAIKFSALHERHRATRQFCRASNYLPRADRTLLLEQTIKSCTRIIRAPRSLNRAVIGKFGYGTRRQGIARDSDAGRKQLTGIGLIFQSDTHGNGLGALQRPRRIKIDALFAAMQCRAAFRAGTFEIYIGGKSCRAVKAPRGGNRLNEAGEFGSCYVDRELGTRLPWPLRPMRFRASL
jgi:hypothetical protein